MSGQSRPDEPVSAERSDLPVRLSQDFKDRVSNVLAQIWRGSHNNPGLFYVLNNSAHFMQERITRSRLACDPPDIILAPNMRGIGFMDFHRAAEAIDIGKRCVERRRRDYAID